MGYVCNVNVELRYFIVLHYGYSIVEILCILRVHGNGVKLAQIFSDVPVFAFSVDLITCKVEHVLLIGNVGIG